MSPILALRDLAILDVLFSTGIRLNELTSINLNDIDWEQRLLRVFGKGGKERVVPYGKETEKSLTCYLQVRIRLIEKNPKEEALFINYRSERLSNKGIERLLTKYNLISDIDKSKPITPHSLRHSCASILLNRGCNIRAIQTLLGHESLATTQRYTHVSPQKLIDVYRRTNLRGNNKKTKRS